MICNNCDYAGRPTYDYPCSNCDMKEWSPLCKYEHTKKKTNADKIRAMSDEKLAEWLLSISTAECPFCWDCQADTCLKCWYKWLKQTAEVE